MSLQIKFTINANQFGIFRTYMGQIIQGASVGLADGIAALFNEVRAVAFDETHRISGALAAGWVVQRATNRVALVNPVPYAVTEFSRPGAKVRGRPPLGTPHNVMPRILDLINSNLQNVIDKSMGNLTK